MARATLAVFAVLLFGSLAAARPLRGPERFQPPDNVPSGAFGRSVAAGEDLFESAQSAGKSLSGNGLVCENCHLDRGRLANAAPMWDAFVAYPKADDESGKVATLEERIADCFRFSLNAPPPAFDSAEMTDLVSYMSWLATNAPVRAQLAGGGYPTLAKPKLSPDPGRGAAIYQARCALCHGPKGQGRQAARRWVFPPLWGAQSFAWGADMSKIRFAAEFIKANMPLTLGGSLADQQAWDVAAFVDSHPRPQDPRFTGSVEQTRQLYHHSGDYYGQMIGGVLLGAPNP